MINYASLLGKKKLLTNWRHIPINMRFMGWVCMSNTDTSVKWPVIVTLKSLIRQFFSFANTKPAFKCWRTWALPEQNTAKVTVNSLHPSLNLVLTRISSFDWRVSPTRVSPGGFASRRTRLPFTPEFGSLVPESPSSHFPTEVEMAHKEPMGWRRQGARTGAAALLGDSRTVFRF